MCETFGYAGGKYTLASHITAVITHYETVLGTSQQPFLDPFMGMCSIPMRIAKQSPQREIYLSDLNPDIVAFWKGIQEGWKGLHLDSEKKFLRVKALPKGDRERGLLYLYSYGGNGLLWKGRYIKKALPLYINRFAHLVPLLANCSIQEVCSYESYGGEDFCGYTVYVDPPYSRNSVNNNKYFHNFKSPEFWEEMRVWSQKNLVFISECVAPPDFVSIWEKKVTCTMFNLLQKSHTVDTDQSKRQSGGTFIYSSILE